MSPASKKIAESTEMMDSPKKRGPKKLVRLPKDQVLTYLDSIRDAASIFSPETEMSNNSMKLLNTIRKGIERMGDES